jgi:intracellular sulfur oxidation DsrE/DsrF family protein
LETLPAAVILQGQAVRLATATNPVGEQLSLLIARQVPLLICRESLSELHLECTLQDSRLVSQMEIAETLLKSEPIYWL